jgi:hypothetical protein
MYSLEAIELCATTFNILLKNKSLYSDLFLYAEVRYGSCSHCGLHVSERREKSKRSYEKIFKIRLTFRIRFKISTYTLFLVNINVYKRGQYI